MNADLCFRFSKSNWEELSKRLHSTDENAWAEGIGVFERRIRERFLSGIDALFAADTKPDSSPLDSARTGHCLLIDTLQGFREAPPSAANPAGPCTFPSGSCIKPPVGTNQQFIKFLGRPAFGGAFNDEVAKKFNSGIRNGILHEAETRRWVIWREEPAGKIVAQEENGYALNRGLFYAAVKEEFESYLRELRDPASKEMRQRFKKKMDELCKET